MIFDNFEIKNLMREFLKARFSDFWLKNNDNSNEKKPKEFENQFEISKKEFEIDKISSKNLQLSTEPCLNIVQIGHNLASEKYANLKVKMGQRLGVVTFYYRFEKIDNELFLWQNGEIVNWQEKLEKSSEEISSEIIEINQKLDKKSEKENLGVGNDLEKLIKNSESGEIKEKKQVSKSQKNWTDQQKILHFIQKLAKNNSELKIKNWQNPGNQSLQKISKKVKNGLILQLPLPSDFASLADQIDWNSFADVDFLGNDNSRLWHQNLLPPTIQAIDFVLKTLSNLENKKNFPQIPSQTFSQINKKIFESNENMEKEKTSLENSQNQAEENWENKIQNNLEKTSQKKVQTNLKNLNFYLNFENPNSQKNSKNNSRNNIEMNKFAIQKTEFQKTEPEKLELLTKSLKNLELKTELKTELEMEKLFRNLDLTRKTVAIIGQGKLVGSPLLSYFVRRNATIISLNKDSPNKEKLVKLADIVVAASGVPNLVKSSWLSKKAIIIDAATSESNGILVGDIDRHELENAENGNFIQQISLCPSPGGIGPLTVLSIFWNLYQIWESEI